MRCECASGALGTHGHKDAHQSPGFSFLPVRSPCRPGLPHTDWCTCWGFSKAIIGPWRMEGQGGLPQGPAEVETLVGKGTLHHGEGQG